MLFRSERIFHRAIRVQREAPKTARAAEANFTALWRFLRKRM
jgi:hypothetical protein